MFRVRGGGRVVVACWLAICSSASLSKSRISCWWVSRREFKSMCSLWSFLLSFSIWVLRLVKRLPRWVDMDHGGFSSESFDSVDDVSVVG